MKIIKKKLKDGEIELQVTNLDDLWQLYNLIEPDDFVSAYSFRRVRQKQETLRPDSGEKVRMYLGIRVTGVEFHAFSNRLRVRGQIKNGPMDLITLDSHHTINLEIHSQFVIKKENWSKFHLIRLKDAVSEKEQHKFLITVVDEREATIGLVTNIGIKIIAHFHETIPGKHFKIAYHDQSMQNFYQKISTVLIENTKKYDIQTIIVAGPGFTKEHFIKHLRQNVSEIKVPISMDNASSASKSGVYEVIKRGATSKILGKLRLIQEEVLINEVLRRLGKNLNDVTYGFDEIQKLVQSQPNAIDKLLMTDIFLREQSIERRKQSDDLIRSIEENKGKIFIISTLHPAGEQLSSLGGIATLLRYPIFQN